MSYTKGPWRFIRPPQKLSSISIRGEGSYGCVASVRGSRKRSAFHEALDDETAIANAYLIAAVPELLEAIEEYISPLVHEEDHVYEEDYVDCDSRSVYLSCSLCNQESERRSNELYRAIAKAKGK